MFIIFVKIYFKRLLECLFSDQFFLSAIVLALQPLSMLFIALFISHPAITDTKQHPRTCPLQRELIECTASYKKQQDGHKTLQYGQLKH